MVQNFSFLILAVWSFQECAVPWDQPFTETIWDITVMTARMCDALTDISTVSGLLHSIRKRRCFWGDGPERCDIYWTLFGFLIACTTLDFIVVNVKTMHLFKLDRRGAIAYHCVSLVLEAILFACMLLLQLKSGSKMDYFFIVSGCFTLRTFVLTMIGLKNVLTAVHDVFKPQSGRVLPMPMNQEMGDLFQPMPQPSIANAADKRLYINCYAA